MRAGDTSLGGAIRDFPQTTWGMIASLSRTENPLQQQGLESLCRRYWKPVYLYARRVWAKSNEDAKDVAQAFFVWILEGEALAKYVPERGGFRRYLKVLLQRFIRHRERAREALKRGGAVRIIPLDANLPEEALPDTKGRDPEALFDDEWRNAVVDHAVEHVRRRHLASGRVTPFRIFEAYDLERGKQESTYREIADRFKIQEDDVRSYLFSVRQEIRIEIRSELEQLTADPSELEEEWNELIGS